MKCPQCHVDNLSNARFCENCGASLASQPPLIGVGPGMMLQNRYRIDSRIGGGAMGSVYKIWDTHLEKDYALKEMCTTAGSDLEKQEVLARFKTEAQLLSMLHHSSIPRVVDYFSEGGGHYLVMDFIAGDDLERWLSRKGRPGLPVNVVKEMAARILDVLSYLHSQSPPVLYRDMKPSNVIKRSSDGAIFLIDFGIAKTLATLKKGTGTAIGTEGYSPPEQYEGKTEPRSDLYALGATMHHLLSGQTPLVPFKFGPLTGIPASLQSFIDKALKLHPEERFASAAEMRQVLLSLDAPQAPAATRITIQKAANASSVAAPASSMTVPVSSPATPSSTVGAASPPSFGAASLSPVGATSPSSSGAPPLSSGSAASQASQNGAGSLYNGGAAQKMSSGKIRRGKPFLKLIVLLFLGAFMGMALFAWKVPDRIVLFFTHGHSGTIHSHPATPGTPWEDEVKDTVRNSMKAIESRDLRKHMSYYADVLDIYYNKKNCTRDFVEKDKNRAIERFHSIKNTISNLSIYRIDDSNAKAIFDKEWDCTNGSRFAGKERQRILLRFLGGTWKIVSEEELEVYWVTK